MNLVQRIQCRQSNAIKLIALNSHFDWALATKESQITISWLIYAFFVFVQVTQKQVLRHAKPPAKV